MIGRALLTVGSPLWLSFHFWGGIAIVAVALLMIARQLDRAVNG